MSTDQQLAICQANDRERSRVSSKVSNELPADSERGIKAAIGVVANNAKCTAFSRAEAEACHYDFQVVLNRDVDRDVCVCTHVSDHLTVDAKTRVDASI